MSNCTNCQIFIGARQGRGQCTRCCRLRAGALGRVRLARHSSHFAWGAASCIQLAAAHVAMTSCRPRGRPRHLHRLHQLVGSRSMPRKEICLLPWKPACSANCRVRLQFDGACGAFRVLLRPPGSPACSCNFAIASNKVYSLLPSSCCLLQPGGGGLPHLQGQQLLQLRVWCVWRGTCLVHFGSRVRHGGAGSLLGILIALPHLVTHMQHPCDVLDWNKPQLSPLSAGLYTSTHPALQGSSGIRIACWAGAYPQLSQVLLGSLAQKQRSCSVQGVGVFAWALVEGKARWPAGEQQQRPPCRISRIPSWIPCQDAPSLSPPCPAALCGGQPGPRRQPVEQGAQAMCCYCANVPACCLSP